MSGRNVHAVLWACLLCVCCAFEVMRDLGILEDGCQALTVFELCIFQSKLAQASEEPENYIILSLVKSKYKI